VKPTSDEWNHYYESARRRRHRAGGDPLELYRVQKSARERDTFVALALVLAAIIGIFLFLFVP
jgi:hypothetical protein